MSALAVALIAATFVSEDAACAAAGALIAGGELRAPLAIGACAFGIFGGDMMLWVIGRAGAGLLARNWFARRVPPARIQEARLWLERNSGRAILMSRFTPGACACSRRPWTPARGRFARRRYGHPPWSWRRHRPRGRRDGSRYLCSS